MPGLFRPQFFRHAHSRAAGTGIPLHLSLARLDYFLREYPETALAGQLLKGVLHGTIFQRVVTENDPTSS
jgi:hypothetical protein